MVGNDPRLAVGRPPPSDPSPTTLRRTLALFYALQFAHMGIVLPFLPPWVERRGFGALGIGILLALPPLFKVLAPWSWGVWADRSGRRRELFVVACLLAAVALACLTLAKGAWTIGFVVALYAFTRAPILPYLEATTLERSEHHRFAYGPIRLWGSLAFMAVSAGYGWMRHELPEHAGLLLAAGFLAAAALPAPFVFPRPLAPPAPPPRGSSAIARRGLWRFFAACAFMQISHGAYYTFYSIHLQRLGYGGAAIGAFWALGVMCEVLLLTRLDRLVDRFGSTSVMRASLVVAALRWLAIGGVGSALPLALAQTLHAVTYAAFHVAAIREVHRRFGSRARAKGQAMYSGLTYGLGMFVGSLVAGALAGRIGIRAAFFASAGIALAALLVLGTPRRQSGSNREE